MPARRSALLVAVVAALVAPVLLSAPAQAAGPDTTADLTITELQPGVEGGDLQFDIECGTNATAAEILYAHNLSVGPTHSFNVTLDGNQQGSDTQSAANFGDPGESFQFQLMCWLPGAPGYQASSVQTVVLYDSGAAAVVPDSTAGSPNSISGTCGTAAADSVSYSAWLDGTTPVDPGDFLFYALGTPLAPDASFAASGLAAAPAAGVYQWVVACSLAGVPAAFRYGSFTVAAGLAVTGDDTAMPIGAAFALLLVGAGLLAAGVVVSRRRRAAARG